VSERVDAGGVSVAVTGADLEDLVAAAMTRLVEDGVGVAIAKQDADVWGPEAAPEAAIRLGWLDCPTTSRALLPRLEALRDESLAAGLDHVVLCGMGGSSLAPEVIAGTAGVPLTVLDTTDPHQVGSALGDRLEATVVVVSSKSGGTIETDSHRRAYEHAFRAAGIDPATRIIVVTDPGSPLEQTAIEAGYRVVPADPNVGGRYSALTAFGLVPSAVAGVDVEALLDDAAHVAMALGQGGADPGVLLGAALGAAAVSGRDKAVLADAGSGIRGFGDWAEQLIAESTGKKGTGVLPVVVEGLSDAGTASAPDRHLIALGGSGSVADGTTVTGPLGGQFLLWEFATAVAGRVLGIDPFNQPNVQESKDNTAALLREHAGGDLPEGEPLLVDGPLAVYGDAALVGATVSETLERLLSAVPVSGYLAAMAYLDRHAEAPTAELRSLLAARTQRSVTFGWGPRFLHSTGQFHKGGPQVGAFLQVTGAVDRDLEIPGRDGLTFGRLQLAQALGDLRALGQRGRPVVRIHLRDRAEGVAALLAAARG
jgi:glucose-6-phosphate isomerase